MARLNMIISDRLDEEMREYVENNNLTITTFLHLAISKYIESQQQEKRMKDLFTALIEEELTKKLNENIKK